MKIGIYTLGCKVNQYETQAMEQELTARGHELVDFESPADAYIINTCSVTAVSDKKSRQMIRRAKKNSPDAVVAACGCYVQTHEKEAKSLGIYPVITVHNFKIFSLCVVKTCIDRISVSTIFLINCTDDRWILFFILMCNL